MNEPARTRLDRLLNWLKNNRSLSIILLLGICVVAIGTFTDALLKIRGFVGSLTKDPLPLHEPIPEDEFPNIIYASGYTLEFSEIMYSKDKEQLDIRVRNTSDETVVLNHVYLYVMYDTPAGGGMVATDVVSVDIEDEIRKSKEERKPFFLRRGYSPCPPPRLAR